MARLLISGLLRGVDSLDLRLSDLLVVDLEDVEVLLFVLEAVLVDSDNDFGS